jgi:c-di-GMP-binding flagellar brake protein YcgR
MKKEWLPMVERRKFERYEMKVPAKVETLARTAGRRKLSLKTANVCAGGAYFCTPYTLTEGTKVRLEIVLTFSGKKKLRATKNARVRIIGTVMRSQKDGMAIRFSEDYDIAPHTVNPDIKAIS